MTIDPLTDPKFADPKLFSDDDRQFMATFFVAHPKVAKNFDHYLTCPPLLRPQMAMHEVAEIPRAGWERRGIVKPETLHEHMQGLRDMVRVHYSGKGPVPLKQKRMEDESFRIADMASVHDMVEAIATDFTPDDPVSEADKDHIERLAAKVIYPGPDFAGRRSLVNEYITQETPLSQLLHDFDKIHAVRHAAYYEATQPGQDGLFQQLFDYAERKMKTPEGKAYLAHIGAHKDEHVAIVSKQCLSAGKAGWVHCV